MKKQNGVHFILGATILAVGLAAWPARAEEWHLVKDGAPQARIVVADDANRLVTTAAEEFQYHVRKATGAELPIVKESAVEGPSKHLVLIGAGQRAAELGVNPDKLPREGYVIHPVQGCLVIAGKDKPLISYANDGKTIQKVNDDPYGEFIHTATMNGVYTYLEEKLGILWIWPGELGEVIPSRKDILVKDAKPRIEGPLFMMRRIRFIGNKANLDKPDEKDVFYEQAGVDRARRIREHRVWEKRQRLGMSGYFKISHSFTRWWDKYSKDHPDYFAQQLDGTRIWPSYWSKEGVRLCLANPAVADQLIEDAHSYLGNKRSNLDCPALSAGQNDGNVGYCLCDKCRALDPAGTPTKPYAYVMKDGSGQWIEKTVELPRLTDRYVHFWNEVARRAEKEFPGVMVGIFAYNATYSPPLRVKYHPNLCMAMATHDFLMAPRNQVAQSFQKRVGELYDAGLRNWYWRPNLMYFDLYGLPLIYAREAGEMIRYGASHGAKGVDIDSWQNHWGTDGLNMYVLSRLAWNPELKVDALIGEYASAFGQAAPLVREYYGRLEELRDRFPEKPAANRNILERFPVEEIYSADVLDELGRLIEKMQAAVKGQDEAVRKRVDYLAGGFRYARFQRDAIAASKKFLATGEGLPEVIAAAAGREKVIADLKNSWAIDAAHLMYHESRGRLAKYSGTKYCKMTQNRDLVKVLPRYWKFYLDQSLEGEQNNLMNADCDDSRLVKIDTWENWEAQGFPDYNGTAWYRTAFTVPKELAGKKVYLWLGAVDESCWIYVNGRKVGENIYDAEKNPRAWIEPIEVDISEAIVFGEENLVSVKVRDIGGAGGIYQPVVLLTPKP